MRERTVPFFCLFVLAYSQAGLAQSPDAVSALGRLEPRHGIINVSSSSMPEATLGGVVIQLDVEEGDDVQEGQLLAVTDTAPVLQAAVAAGEAELGFRQREVKAARSASQEACVRASVALQEAERRVLLHERGLAGEEEMQSTRGEAEAQAASCSTSQTAVELAVAGVAVAEAKLARVKAELNRSYIRAPMDGRVLRVIRRPGELLGESGLLELGDVANMQAVAEVYETDIRFVSQGQKATIKSPALDSELSGVVSRIRPKVAKQDEIGTDPAARKDARIVEVFIDLDDSTPARSLTNLQVDILIHR